MVLPDFHGISRVPRYSGTSKGRHISFVYRTITFFGPPFQAGSTRDLLCNFPAARYCDQSTPHNPVLPTRTGFNSRNSLGCCPFAHHYLGNHCYFLFLRLLRCFSSPRYPPWPMDSVRDALTSRLSNSEISGSKCVCHSPELIAAYHVLRRQPMPRHPPYTFIHLVQINYISTK